jgi:hypothetical protein
MHDFARKQPVFLESVLKFLSPERLNPYKIDKDTVSEMLVRYFWNIKLCESLYLSLQNLEIVLRNAINNACFKYFDDEHWYEQGFFKQNELDEIEHAKEKLYKQKKRIDGCRVVAELNFGYWTSLFNDTYDVSIFRPVLINVFTNAPKMFRKRSVLSKMLNDIRKLRNRVFHYEPIWNDRDLERKHNDILELLYWINKDMFCTTWSFDTFSKVYADGALVCSENILRLLSK